jgi:DNA-binding MarR family transcriptional regulator
MLDDLLERLLSEGDGIAVQHVGLGMLLATAHQHSREVMNEGLRPLGVDVRGFALLLALERYGPSSQRQLIDRMRIDKSTMVRLVDELEAGALVSRERSPQDRRAHSVVLTRAGERVLADALRVAADVGDSLFGTLSDEDRAQLVGLLRRLVR